MKCRIFSFGFSICPFTHLYIMLGTGSNPWWFIRVRKRAKIRNRYNQSPHLTEDTNGKVTSQLDTTNESKEVSPFPAVDHKAGRICVSLLGMQVFGMLIILCVFMSLLYILSQLVVAAFSLRRFCFVCLILFFTMFTSQSTISQL